MSPRTLSRIALGLILLCGSAVFGQIKPAPGLDEDEIVTQGITLVDEETNQVLVLLEQITGRIILRPQGVTPMKFNFEANEPLTRKELIKVLESILSMNSLAIVELDDKFLRAVPINAPVNALTPPFVSGDLPDVENTQKVYAKIFQIKYLKMDSAVEIITRFLTPNLPPPVIFQQSNKILLTDSINNLKRVAEVLADADTPAQQREQIFFIQLQNTQSRDLQQRLDNMIQRSLEKFLVGETTIESEERTNQIILITHPANEATIRELIEQMDKDASAQTTTEVFRVNHAKAEELSPLIESVITSQRQARENAERTARQNSRSQQRTAPQNNAPAPGQNQPAAATPAQPAATGSTSGDSGVKNVQFSEYVGVVPDPRTNSIIAYGTPSDIRQLKVLMKNLDVLLPQVLIEAVIAEVTLNENQTRGIDALNIDLDYASGVWALSNIGAGAYGATISDGRVADASQKGDFPNFDLNLQILGMGGNGDVRVLSAPRILTTHARPAEIDIGERRPIITSSQTDSTGTSTRSQVTYQNIGIKLEVEPLIGNDGKIQLDLTQTVENISGFVTVDGNDQPVIGSRNADSFISVNSGDVVILGGIQSYDIQNTRSKMGIFGAIPVIGDAIFTRKGKTKTRTELMIFIRPRILNSTREASDFTQESLDNSKALGSDVNNFLEDGLEILEEEDEQEDTQPKTERSFFNPRARSKN